MKLKTVQEAFVKLSRNQKSQTRSVVDYVEKSNIMCRNGTLLRAEMEGKEYFQALYSILVAVAFIEIYAYAEKPQIRTEILALA